MPWGLNRFRRVRADALRDVLLLPSPSLVHHTHPQASFRDRARGCARQIRALRTRLCRHARARSPAAPRAAAAHSGRRYTGAVVRTEGVLMGPFGDSFTETNTSLDFTGFADGFWDTENNGEHFGAREYQNIHGSWLSPDPAGMAAVDPSNPQTWNRYAYVGNDPLSYIDPLGLVRTPWGTFGSTVSFLGTASGFDLMNIPVVATGRWYWNDGWHPVVVGNGADLFGGETGGGQGGPYFYALADSCGGGPANNDPQTGVPANPCASAGGAPNPSSYVAQVQQVGNQFPGSPFNSANSLMNQLNQFTTLLNFHQDGSLDAQALGGSWAYGNYVFGAALSGAGYSLPFTLLAANTYAAVKNAQYPGFTKDPKYSSIPQANAANIVNGYNAQRNGTLCHK